ncbi:MAG: TRAP transporter large permease, partial [Pseudomonadota bacterium]
AGIIPGLLMAAAFALVITLIGWSQEFPTGKWMSRRAAARSVLAAIPAMLVPAAIIGGILLGVATPTESAAIASLIAFLVGWLVYRDLDPKTLGEMFKRTAANASMILFMIAAASVFGWVIIYEELPQKLAALITSITSDPFMFLIIVNLALLLVGMVIDGIAAIILITPILLPIATGSYDISPYQFGIVACLNLVLGLLTPPVGIGLYIASSMSGATPGSILKSLWPFLIAVALVLVLLSYFPVLSTYLI